MLFVVLNYLFFLTISDSRKKALKNEMYSTVNSLFMLAVDDSRFYFSTQGMSEPPPYYHKSPYSAGVEALLSICLVLGGVFLLLPCGICIFMSGPEAGTTARMPHGVSGPQQ